MEEWRNIKDYPNYQVSNLGRVKSLNFNRTGKEGILKFGHDGHGYLTVKLAGKVFKVHRLVAESFIPNPNNYPEVNHKDENKSNNCVDNLEWCSHKYNINYGTRLERVAKSMTNNPKCSIPIKCLDLETIETNYYSSISEAARYLKIQKSSIFMSIYKYKKPYKKRYIFTEKKEKD